MVKYVLYCKKKRAPYNTLWENSNFLGDNPREWYSFSNKCYTFFHSPEEAEEHKQVLLDRIARQIEWHVEYLNQHDTLRGHIPASIKRSQEVYSLFDSLVVKAA